MSAVRNFFIKYLSWLSVPAVHISVTDILEIIILSIIVYRILLWIKDTRAWTLLKGIVFICMFILIAKICQMDTIMYIITKGLDMAIVAALVIFQPELRRALEQLGEKKFFSSFIPLKEKYKTNINVRGTCVPLARCQTLILFYRRLHRGNPHHIRRPAAAGPHPAAVQHPARLVPGPLAGKAFHKPDRTPFAALPALS